LTIQKAQQKGGCNPKCSKQLKGGRPQLEGGTLLHQIGAALWRPHTQNRKGRPHTYSHTKQQGTRPHPLHSNANTRRLVLYKGGCGYIYSKHQETAAIDHPQQIQGGPQLYPQQAQRKAAALSTAGTKEGRSSTTVDTKEGSQLQEGEINASPLGTIDE
jgi:hypothetical protein